MAAVPGEQQHIRSLPGIYCGMRELSFADGFRSLQASICREAFLYGKLSGLP